MCLAECSALEQFVDPDSVFISVFSAEQQEFRISELTPSPLELKFLLEAKRRRPSMRRIPRLLKPETFIREKKPFWRRSRFEGLGGEERRSGSRQGN